MTRLEAYRRIQQGNFTGTSRWAKQTLHLETLRLIGKGVNALVFYVSTKEHGPCVIKVIGLPKARFRYRLNQVRGEFIITDAVKAIPGFVSIQTRPRILSGWLLKEFFEAGMDKRKAKVSRWAFVMLGKTFYDRLGDVSNSAKCNVWYDMFWAVAHALALGERKIKLEVSSADCGISSADALAAS